MGWFDEQIKQRKKNDDSTFNSSFIDIAEGILTRNLANAFATNSERTRDSINAIFQYFHLSTPELPSNIHELNDQLEYLMHPYGIMRRAVNMEDNWFKQAMGPMLGFSATDDSAVALIPVGISGYKYYDPDTGDFIKITKKNVHKFKYEAYVFYKPFPQTKLSFKNLLSYMLGVFSVWDYILIGLLTLGITLIGYLTPKLQFLLMGTVVASKQARLLLGVMIFMLSANFASLLFSMVKNVLMAQLQIKLDLTIQAATMARILSLPSSYFKNYSSGEIANISGQIRALCEQTISSILTSTPTALFSLVYIVQVFEYAPGLLVPSLLILLATVLFSVLIGYIQIDISRKTFKLQTKEAGILYSIISGIQKIKLAGAEKRAFARWSKPYSEIQKLIPTIIRYKKALSLIISGVGAVVMYFMAIKTNISVENYMAFNSAYGMVSGAFMTMVGVAITFASLKPLFELVKPILDTEPEISANKEVITRLSGSIDLNNVSFKYTENMPNVIDNLSLKINFGQYVAIVGPTGCGKSTLVRLLLGFEKPQRGAIYYDGKDINAIDLKSLRQRIGVVMQNGKLFSGDIFSNITISAPWLSLDDAWEAARIAGLEEDIKRMPMGMHTLISEGSGGISGGQKQRLLIATAVAPKPKILMLDEATSALDNLTQKQVSEALDKLKCTRIVIAHRLSTIKQCDRIIYLEDGHILEDGTYDELIAKNGKFAALVERQRIDS